MVSGMYDAAIEVSELRYRYDRYEAVAGVNFSVRAGEIFALLGTNGAGKTTTLEVVEGFRKPTAGTVRLLGRDPLSSRSELAVRVGVMLQEAGLIDELTVRETLRMWATLNSRTDGVDELLDTVELGGRKHSTVEKLSGGEKRRLDFAMAIWGRPDVVILDEPTTGLDPQSRQRLWKIIGGLRDRGSAVLLTTHYLEEAETLADRVAIMHEGRVSLSGTLAEVLDTHPARITAGLRADAATRLPEFLGVLHTTDDDGGLLLTIETPDLQRDLRTLLNWAHEHAVLLHRLNASQASLQEIFLGIGELEDA